MGNLLVCPNSNKLLLTPRCASTSFCMAAIDSFWPDVRREEELHPAHYLPIQEYYDGTQHNVALIVRNPMDRFLSAIKHKNLDIEYLLARPKNCPPLPSGDFVYFKFETQLQSCADWLGINSPLLNLNESDNNEHINLNTEQLVKFNKLYLHDINLWQSL